MENFDLKKALRALSDGKLVVYPTDTLYGLGADIFNIKAVNKVYNVKKRPLNNPLSVAVSNLSDIEKIAYVEDKTRKLINSFLPGKLTIILKKKDSVPDVVTAGLNKIAVRIPNNKIALELLSKYGPITATSANIHGKKTPAVIKDINMQFKDEIALYIDDGELKGEPSTIIDVTSDEFKIIREGAINKNQLLDMI